MDSLRDAANEFTPQLLARRLRSIQFLCDFPNHRLSASSSSRDLGCESAPSSLPLRLGSSRSGFLVDVPPNSMRLPGPIEATLTQPSAGLVQQASTIRHKLNLLSLFLGQYVTDHTERYPDASSCRCASSRVNSLNGVICHCSRECSCSSAGIGERDDPHLQRYGGRLRGGADQVSEDEEPSSQRLGFPLLCSCVMTFGGVFACGYDLGSSSAALHNLVVVPSPKFLGMAWIQSPHFTPMEQGWVVSSRWFGSMLGSSLAYSMTRMRTGLFGASIITFCGTVIVCSAHGLSAIIVGRILQGIGDGITNSLTAAYVGEIAPPSARGTAVGMIESAFKFGALTGAVAGQHFIDVPGGWRQTWVIMCPVSLAAAVAINRLPDAPRTIFRLRLEEASRGEIAVDDIGGTGSSQVTYAETQTTAAIAIARVQVERSLCEVRGLREPDAAMLAEIHAIEERFRAAAARNERNTELSLVEILSSTENAGRLAVGTLVMSLPAITGHAAILAFTTQVFQGVGYDSGLGSKMGVVLYATIAAVSIPGAFIVDFMDRRTLMNVGLAGIYYSFSFAAFAAGLHYPRAAVAGLLANSAIYQLSAGPLSWVLVNEVFPSYMRVGGSAIATLFYQASFAMSIQLHPSLQARLGVVGALIFYNCTTSIGFYLCYRFLPETRGLSLEEIDEGARWNED
eukprot:TRINITY_DN42153_c0_g1_i1.p1 TRINITY_DN42153_c0_g1~~TRINITY_DN42153_c0_g1_i1.p1  ORF type:complete len:682 (-),score=61.38 TRINITY_DN42153_c0_g1_i1:30-2075(-)